MLFLMECKDKIKKYLPEVPGFSFSSKMPVAGFPGVKLGSQIARQRRGSHHGDFLFHPRGADL
jgi:hypothetical protein